MVNLSNFIITKNNGRVSIVDPQTSSLQIMNNLQFYNSWACLSDEDAIASFSAPNKYCTAPNLVIIEQDRARLEALIAEPIEVFRDTRDSCFPDILTPPPSSQKPAQMKHRSTKQSSRDQVWDCKKAKIVPRFVTDSPIIDILYYDRLRGVESTRKASRSQSPSRMSPDERARFAQPSIFKQMQRCRALGVTAREKGRQYITVGAARRAGLIPGSFPRDT